MENKVDFFISYTSRDRAWAEWIGWVLEENKYTTKVQAWDFAIGQNFVLEMDKASKACKRTLLVLSAAYQASKYTPSEWAAAFARDPTGEEALLIPVRVEDCVVDGLLGPLARVDVFSLSEEQARHAILAAVARTRAKPQTAPAFPQNATPARRPAYPIAVFPPPLVSNESGDVNSRDDDPYMPSAKPGLADDWHSEAITAFREALADRNPSSRRKTVTSLIERTGALRPKTVNQHLLLARLHRAAALDSATIGAAQKSWDRAIEAAIRAIELLQTDKDERSEALGLLAELAVDYAQTGLTMGVEANRLVKNLNLADSELGKDLFTASKLDGHLSKDACALMLAQRSKVNRALAKIKHVRGAPGNPRDQQAAIRKCRENSLRFAEAAANQSRAQACRFEKILSYLAASKDFEDSRAVSAIAELRGLVAEGYLAPAGYELCRQLNFRHLLHEVIALFPRVFEADSNRRRAYQSVHDYAWALKGLHSSSQFGGALPAHFEEEILRAKLWLEESVAYGYSTAIDRILLAYMRATLGLPMDESLDALANLNPIGGGVINELDDLAKQRPEGLAGGLMLGLSDPTVYGLIGTYLKTWTPYTERALRFYEKARLLEPAHPMHIFNKALVLADLGRTSESAVALKEAISKGSNRRNWFTANNEAFEKLRLRLELTSPPQIS